MGRIIKFRAWDKEKKKFLWGGDVRVNGDGDIYSLESYRGNSDWVNDDSLIIQRFTGFKDESGKEIYEGDILAFDGFRYDAGPYKLKVSWDNQQGCWQVSDHNYVEFLGNVWDGSEIIGNIYEKS